MLIIQVCFQYAVVQSEIKVVTHCYIRLLYLRTIHLILQAAIGPSIICDLTKTLTDCRSFSDLKTLNGCRSFSHSDAK